MGAGKASQIAPLTATVDDVLDRITGIADALKTFFHCDAPTHVQADIREWSTARGIEQPFTTVARYATWNLLLKATLYERYAFKGHVPFLRGNPQDAFETAAGVTGNQAFTDTQLDRFAWQAPREIVAELCWWRHGLLTADSPADTIGYLFDELLPPADRRRHGQFRTPRRISRIMRELAISDGDQVLDAGMGAGALSVPRDEESAHSTFGIEQSRLGFLMAVTALALTDQPGIVHEADFFDVTTSSLGMVPAAAISMGPATDGIDILPENVDAAIGNPPYVANRNLDKESEHYRQHLSAFGDRGETPYLDGEKRLSGRSDLFVYFLTHATQFLHEGGRLVYLLPTKWMETQYGQTLQEFLFDQYCVSAIIKFDDTVFDDAQVNAVILVAERCTDQAARQDTATRFITINSDVCPATIHDLVFDGTVAPGVDAECDAQHSDCTPGYEITTVRQAELAARTATDGPLTQYFTAAPALRSLQQSELLVSLDELASVTYGVKTGDNELFLLSDADLDVWPLADRFHTPALHDLSSVTGYRLTATDSDTSLLDVHTYVTSLEDFFDGENPCVSRTQAVLDALDRDGYDALQAYLEEYSETRDSSQADEAWFDLGGLDAPEIVHPYRVHKDVRVFKNAAGLVPTNCANGIDVDADVETTVLLGYLNSTLHAAFLELWGQSEGGGSLEITTGTLREMPVADIRALSSEARNAISAAYNALVEGEANAQTTLDAAVLAALDADVDAATIQETLRALTRDRLPDAG